MSAQFPPPSLEEPSVSTSFHERTESPDDASPAIENDGSKLSKWRIAFGIFSLLMLIVSWIAQGELAQYLQQHKVNGQAFNQPFFIVWFNHIFMALMLPAALLYLYFSDEFKRTIHCAEYLTGTPRSTKTAGKLKYTMLNLDGEPIYTKEWPWEEFMRDVRRYMRWWGFSPRRYVYTGMALGQGYLWPNWLWYVGLPHVALGTATAVFNTSCAFCYVFSVLLLGDKWDLVKIIAVALSVGGVGLIGASSGGGSFNGYIALILAAAMMYGLWEVSYRKYVVREEDVPMPIVMMMLGMVGITHLLVLWVMMPLLDVVGQEHFRMPPDLWTWNILIANAMLATAFNVFFMISLVLIPSPLLVSMALLLTIPLSDVTDIILHGTSFPPMAIIGSVLICVGFVILSVKEHQEHKLRTMRYSRGEFDELVPHPRKEKYAMLDTPQLPTATTPLTLDDDA